MILLLGTPLAIHTLATTATSETPPTNRPRLKKLRSLGVWLRGGSECLSNDHKSNYTKTKISDVITFLGYLINLGAVHKPLACNRGFTYYKYYGTIWVQYYSAIYVATH